MPVIPPPLPEQGNFRALYGWLNRLRDYVMSLTPIQSHNMRTGHTSMGVSREGTGAKKVVGEAQGVPRWL